MCTCTLLLYYSTTLLLVYVHTANDAPIPAEKPGDDETRHVRRGKERSSSAKMNNDTTGDEPFDEPPTSSSPVGGGLPSPNELVSEGDLERPPRPELSGPEIPITTQHASIQIDAPPQNADPSGGVSVSEQRSTAGGAVPVAVESAATVEVSPPFSHGSEPNQQESAHAAAPDTAYYAANEFNDDEDGEIRYTDDDIQRDAANIAVMAMVNIALIFFAGLFVCAVAGSILLMGHFGFVTFTIILCLVAIVIGTVLWVIQIVDHDRKLKPVKRKMKRWQAIAKAVVVNEIENFKLDWQEHLMLTNGGDGDDYDDYQEMDDDGENNVEGALGAISASAGAVPGSVEKNTTSSSSTRGSDRPRSVIFGLVVHPFLKGKKKMRRLGRKKKKKNENIAGVTSNYVAPAATKEMV